VNINSRVASGPTQLSQLLHQRRNPSLRYRTILILRHKHADAPHPLRLLRAGRERPRGRCTAEQRYERASPHGALPSSGLGPHITTPLRKNAAVHHSKNCALMSQMGREAKNSI
jgi:hypothetical protein